MLRPGPIVHPSVHSLLRIVRMENISQLTKTTYVFLRFPYDGNSVLQVVPWTLHVLCSGGWQRPEGEELLIERGEEYAEFLLVMVHLELLILLCKPTLLFWRVR